MAQPSPKEFQPYRRVQGEAERDLRRILELAAKQIRLRVAGLKPGVGGEVRKAQLNLTLAAIRKIQRSMWRTGVAGVVKGGIDDAQKAAESAIETMTRVAYASLPDAAAEELVRGLRAAAESGIKSDAARRKRELSARVYRQEALYEGKVEDIIRQGLVSGLSAKELAADVYKFVSPTAPGGQSYSAMRLARTEINNAFHERQVAGATRPGVEAVQWNLSGSHKVPDECNLYAAHKPYPPDAVPDKPHPNCFCYLTYVMMSSEEFRDKLAAGDFDDEIERRTRENMARLGQPVGDITPPVEVASSSNIRKSYDSGLKRKPKKLSGGAIASTSLLSFRDGTQGVQKVYQDLPDDVMDDLGEEDKKYIPSAKDLSDAEELGAMFARSLGLNAAEVTRINETTTVQQFMEGSPAAKARRTTNLNKYFTTDAGWVVGLMDQVTGNHDRNEGNWLITEDDEIVLIDFGGAWSPTPVLRDDVKLPMQLSNDGFEKLLRDGFTPGTRSFKKSNDISPADMKRMKEILEALKPEFQKRNQLGWWKWSMQRIDILTPFAKGKTRRIP